MLEVVDRVYWTWRCIFGGNVFRQVRESTRDAKCIILGPPFNN